MVNYAWVGGSQGKPWWTFAAILTCKSFVRPRYRPDLLVLASMKNAAKCDK